ncbi:serine/threonine-protein kinase/endoribonuclease IRE1b-like protein [Tanacetum coccineum]|uniref:Serine/threonine-protein kinase/endoribonuclease IRE1b-like protein n=1 Tax=Tanacetum coccineum TaxID=301880 RepID=A0ABQ4Y6A9_9ASTR
MAEMMLNLQMGSSANWDDDADGLNEIVEGSIMDLATGWWEPFMDVLIMADLNGTLHLVDLVGRRIYWSSATEEQIYAAHHSKNSNFYLDFGHDNNLYICKDTPQLSFKLPLNDIDEFIENQPKEYLDELWLDLDTASLLRVERVDHEIACYSLKNGERLWYLKFSDFKAKMDCGCGGITRCDCYPPIHVYGTHQPGRLAFIFKKHDLYINDESQLLLDYECFQEKDEDDTTVIHVPTKKKNKTAANADEQKELNETENGLISQCQTDKLLVTDITNQYDTKAIPVPSKLSLLWPQRFTCADSGLFKRVVALGLVGSQCRVGNTGNLKYRRARKTIERKTTTNTDEKMRKELNEIDNDLISQCQSDKLLATDKELGKGSNNLNVSKGKCDGLDVAVTANVNGDKDVETEVQNPEVPDPNYNLVGFHFVKFHLGFAYLVSKRCVCSLHDLMSLVNNLPFQVQRTTEVVKAMEFLLKPNNWVELTRDIAEELLNLHKNGNAHGDLSPHNVYIGINNNAIIPKRLNADMSSLSNDAASKSCSHSKAIDCYNMGRIIVFIASNGKHEFCDASKNDMNNSKDRQDLKLIKDEPEAYDLASKLLHHDPLLRPTAAFVCSHILYWKDHDDVVVLENSETKEEDVKEDESDHNKERYTFEEDDDDDGEFDDLD